MTRDDIIRLAREAGWNGIYSKPLMSIRMQEENFLRFAALVAAAEREACAKVCEEIAKDNDAEGADIDWVTGNMECADYIRARGAV
jgi:hypothetical protein